MPVVTLLSPQSSAPAGGTSKFNQRLAKLAALANPDEVHKADTPVIVPLHGSLFDDVNLGYLDAGKPPAPAAVSLQFDPSRAGAKVWLQPMDGGAIVSQDAEGQAVSSKGGGAFIIDATGKVSFSFQALARPGRYQMLIRLDSVSSVLPFVILDPQGDD